MKKRRRAGIGKAGLAAAIALASLGASAPDPDAVPFELYKGHLFVRAHVNGQGPYRFGFDTGASGMGRIDSSLVAALALPKVGERANSDGIKTVTNDTVSVSSLQLGDVEKRALTLIARDYNHGRKDHAISGIIGRDFFADRLVTIDYGRKTIRLGHGALKAADPGVVAYSAGFVIPVCFASGCFPAKLDTGSSRAIVVPKDLVARIAAGPAKRIGEAARTNSVATLYEMELNEPVRIGGMTVLHQKVIYADPSDSTINVGSDFLKDYVLTIDQQHRLLQISRPKP
jgi:hypothetical protein